ncbi:MAG: bifunctional oligoribonuclease/PAP phosphatase NrnA [Vulcanibacillus sp.]
MISYDQQLIEAGKFINENDDFLIVSHVHPDGDTISSSLAIAYILNIMGKSYQLINQDKIPDKYNFLDMSYKFEVISSIEKKYTNLITLDIAEINRAGNINELLNKKVRILNIDHHFTNDNFGEINIVMPSAAATTEVIYYLINKMGIQFDKNLATYIYTGLLTDTGGFRYSNTNSNVMRIAAEMLEYDISPASIAEITLETITKNYLEILKKALSNLEIVEGLSIAWTTLTYSDLANLEEETEGIVSYARNIEGVEVGIFFRETSPNEYKVSLRSRNFINVGTIAQVFGGGGHNRAAGFSYSGLLDSIKSELLAEIKKTKEWKEFNES